jgi:hypothetical protein
MHCSILYVLAWRLWWASQAGPEHACRLQNKSSSLTATLRCPAISFLHNVGPLQRLHPPAEMSPEAKVGDEGAQAYGAGKRGVAGSGDRPTVSAGGAIVRWKSSGFCDCVDLCASTAVVPRKRGAHGRRCPLGTWYVSLSHAHIAQLIMNFTGKLWAAELRTSTCLPSMCNVSAELPIGCNLSAESAGPGEGGTTAQQRSFQEALGWRADRLTDVQYGALVNAYKTVEALLDSSESSLRLILGAGYAAVDAVLAWQAEQKQPGASMHAAGISCNVWKSLRLGPFWQVQ